MSTFPRSPERKEFLDDLLITAVEGGINYWAQVSGYKFTDVPGEAEVTVHDLESEHQHFVDIDVIAKGLGRLQQDEGLRSLYSDLLVASRTNGEDGDFDASGADVVLQLGIFGEVIYG